MAQCWPAGLLRSGPVVSSLRRPARECAAAANAVTAGINAKDAICLLLAGRTTAADDHRAAVAELRALGRPAGDSAVALDRLLGVKDRAQYDRRDVSEADAKASLRRARTLVEAAVRLLHPVPGG